MKIKAILVIEADLEEPSEREASMLLKRLMKRAEVVSGGAVVAKVVEVRPKN